MKYKNYKPQIKPEKNRISVNTIRDLIKIQKKNLEHSIKEEEFLILGIILKM